MPETEIALPLWPFPAAQEITEVLGEVADIAMAAGVDVKGATIAKAVQLMLVRYVTDQGLDATQLQQAMAQVNHEQLGAAMDQISSRISRGGTMAANRNTRPFSRMKRR